MSVPFDNNQYIVRIIRHIDADTTEVECLVGFDMTIKLTVRWAGIDAPERGTDEGRKATIAVKEKLPEGSTCLFRSYKLGREKFGRYLGTFFLEDGTNLNEWLVEQGHAVPSSYKEDYALR